MSKLILLMLGVVSIAVSAQDRCGTVEYEKFRHERNPSLETIDQFENWIKNKLSQKTDAFKSGRIEGSSYVIPIVVHVIHNGEPVGTGPNISDAQILSQIPVINNDYPRLNADTTKTLDEFKPVAGKMNITFVMAKQDPNGLPTNGIVRVKGTQTSWSISDNYTFKALSYWPAEEYLNIWVVDLTGGLIGYTQLPVSSTLQGLQDTSNDRLTDGVVVDYQAYGTAQATGGSSFNLLGEYNLGRTATHEIGHFFGLRHVWGDVNSCDPSVSTDYVADTPIQDTNYNGLCPTGTQTECSVHTMYSNYMNYTDDACMNIFSQGQVGRMDVIINNSPRRVSLLTSPGAQPPSPVANDMGIKSIDNPGTTICSGNVIPSITVRNYGSNNVTSVEIEFYLNGVSKETQTISPINISPTNETSLSFSPVTVIAGSSYNFSFKILETNGGADGKSSNDSLAVSTMVPVAAPLPLTETFNTTPANWQIVNTDNIIAWSSISLPGSNKAMFLNFYDYQNSGATDWLITPVLDLTTATVASLTFDHAYAQFDNSSNDRLRVLVSTSCDFNSSPVEVFNKSGSELATASATSGSFIPLSSQWKTSIISLNQFIGQKIQIAFEGINDYGNNLYLDNVTVLNYPLTAFALNDIISPSPVSCKTISSPVISVRNLGNTTINSFTADVYTNSQKTTESITGIQLGVGTTNNFTLSPATFSSGNNTLSIAIKSPNGSVGTTSSDSLYTKLVINPVSDIIPLRENFDDNFIGKWETISPMSGSIWYPASTDKAISMVFHSFDNTNLGEQGWLVSPTLDFSKAHQASVIFKTSYAYRSNGSETLQVFYSTDCGVNFDKMVFTSTGNSLSNTQSDISWLPSIDNDWRTNYINLDSAGGRENIRIAFVATNDNGNNLYIDDIEFYVDDNPSPPTINNLYSVYGGLGSPVQVTFNLPERQLVRMQVYDLMGHLLSDDLLPDTLNQTFTIDATGESRGLYIVRVQTQTPSTITSTKVLFGF